MAKFKQRLSLSVCSIIGSELSIKNKFDVIESIAGNVLSISSLKIFIASDSLKTASLLNSRNYSVFIIAPNYIVKSNLILNLTKLYVMFRLGVN